MFNDLMENIEWFFNLHDKNKDGYLTKDEVLTLSESLLVSSSHEDMLMSAHKHCSSFSAMRSEMHTLEPSAGSCPMHLSTEMLSCRGLRARIPRCNHHRSSLTSRI